MSQKQELATARTITGLHEAQTLAGKYMVDNLSAVNDRDGSLYRNLVDNGFGNSLALSGIQYREYALRTIAILIAIGDCGDQLDVYLEAALLHGATEAEILSVIDQTSLYTGFPRAVNALRKMTPRIQSTKEVKSCRIRERVIALSDHETLVRDTGATDDSVPFLLIHALCMDGLMFQKLVPKMVEASPGLRVISYDMRGHGYSRGAPLTKNIGQLVEDLRLLLDRLEIKQVDLVGSSYGGAVAEMFAITHPDRVRALCPMATGGKGNPVLLSRATRALAGEMPTLRTESMIRWFLPETIADDTWCARYARNKLDHVNISEWAAAWQAMAAYDAFSGLKKLDCPVLVLCGSKDASATPAEMKPIHQAFLDVGKSNSQYVEIPGGTHMMPMEQYQQVAQALISWREKVDSL